MPYSLRAFRLEGKVETLIGPPEMEFGNNCGLAVSSRGRIVVGDAERSRLVELALDDKKAMTGRTIYAQAEPEGADIFRNAYLFNQYAVLAFAADDQLIFNNLYTIDTWIESKGEVALVGLYDQESTASLDWIRFQDRVLPASWSSVGVVRCLAAVPGGGLVFLDLDGEGEANPLLRFLGPEADDGLARLTRLGQRARDRIAAWCRLAPASQGGDAARARDAALTTLASVRLVIRAGRFGPALPTLLRGLRELESGTRMASLLGRAGAEQTRGPRELESGAKPAWTPEQARFQGVRGKIALARLVPPEPVAGMLPRLTLEAAEAHVAKALAEADGERWRIRELARMRRMAGVGADAPPEFLDSDDSDDEEAEGADGDSKGVVPEASAPVESGDTPRLFPAGPLPEAKAGGQHQGTKRTHDPDGGDSGESPAKVQRTRPPEPAGHPAPQAPAPAGAGSSSAPSAGWALEAMDLSVDAPAAVPGLAGGGVPALPALDGAQPARESDEDWVMGVLL